MIKFCASPKQVWVITRHSSGKALQGETVTLSPVIDIIVGSMVEWLERRDCNHMCSNLLGPFCCVLGKDTFTALPPAR